MWNRNQYTGPGGGMSKSPGGGLSTISDCGASTKPGGGMSTAPGGGLSEKEGGGLSTERAVACLRNRVAASTQGQGEDFRPNRVAVCPAHRAAACLTARNPT